MFAYRQLNGYTYVPPGQKYPAVESQSPSVYPQTPTKSPSIMTWYGTTAPAPTSQNTSSQAMLDLMDENADDPGTRTPTVVPPPQPVFASEPMAPAKRVVGIAPLGIVAIGAGLLATWAIFRK